MELLLIEKAGLLTIILVPLGTAILIGGILFFLRYIFYKKLHIWIARSETRWDDIIITSTRIPSILWSIWLGLWGGMIASQLVVQLPQNWQTLIVTAIPLIFVTLGIYSILMLIVGTLKWYKVEVCPRTKSALDDVIMSVLIIGIPVISSGLGIILLLNMLNIKSGAVNNWILAHGANLGFLILLTVVLLLITIQITPRMVNTVVRKAKAEQTEEELIKRADTLIGVIVTTLQIGIIFIFLLMILSELGTNITAILTGAGVLGIAIGFGAQSLVRDIIAGLFIIMENQYRKGDVVKIAEISGLVEEINLRRTILRDMDGIIHIVPNGEIKVASNLTKLWSRVNLNVSVAYNTDLDRAIEVINRVGKELAADPLWAASIITPPKVLRVDKLGDSGIELKILGETKPIKQWDVMGELRLRLKRAFDKEGIEIPWPHVKIFFGNLTESLWPNGREIDKPSPN
jgi:small-conductance mechanosensitive channel